MCLLRHSSLCCILSPLPPSLQFNSGQDLGPHFLTGTSDWVINPPENVLLHSLASWSWKTKCPRVSPSSLHTALRTGFGRVHCCQSDSSARDNEAPKFQWLCSRLSLSEVRKGFLENWAWSFISPKSWAMSALTQSIPPANLASSAFFGMLSYVSLSYVTCKLALAIYLHEDQTVSHCSWPWKRPRSLGWRPGTRHPVLWGGENNWQNRSLDT